MLKRQHHFGFLLFPFSSECEKQTNVSGEKEQKTLRKHGGGERFTPTGALTSLPRSGKGNNCCTGSENSRNGEVSPHICFQFVLSSCSDLSNNALETLPSDLFDVLGHPVTV